MLKAATAAFRIGHVSPDLHQGDVHVACYQTKTSMGGPCRNRTEPHRTTQNHREPRKTEEDDSLKWGELTVFLKFIQTYLGCPPLCVDGYVSVTCVWTAISMWTAISLSRRSSLQTTISADGHLCVDGHLSLPVICSLRNIGLSVVFSSKRGV